MKQSPGEALVAAVLDDLRAAHGARRVHNLRANPAAHIEIGTESFDAVAQVNYCYVFRQLQPLSAP